MVEIIGPRDNDNEPADLSRLKGVRSVGGKDAGRIEAGVANLERQHAFERRMAKDFDVYGEERIISAEAKKIEKALSEMVLNINREIDDAVRAPWENSPYVPKGDRLTQELEDYMLDRLADASAEARYEDWNVENDDKHERSLAGHLSSFDGIDLPFHKDILSVPQGGLFEPIPNMRFNAPRRRPSSGTRRARLAEKDRLKFLDRYISMLKN